MKRQGEPEASISQRENELADFVENAVVSLHWVAADGTILWANQAELDFLGYTREEYIGHPITEFHADQAVIEDILKRLTAGEKLSNYEAQLRCKDGSIKHVLISSSVRFEDEQFVHTRCFTLDITERKQAESRMVLLYELTAALSKAVTLQQVGEVIVEQVILKMGAQAGLVTLLNQDGNQLEVLDAEGYQESELKLWQSFSVDSPIPLAESVRSQQPLWLRSMAEFQTRFPSVELQPERHHAWAAIPLIVENRIIGALGLGFATAQRFDKDDQRFMIALSQQSAQALERARLSEMARDQAVLEVRQQLARDLHDSVSQTLFTINTLAQTAPRVWERDPKQAQEQLEQLTSLTQGAISEMRTLLFELRPTMLVKIPLQELFMQLIAAAQGVNPITLTAQVELQQAVPEIDHMALYRIVQEGINNIVKHSHATEGRISLIELDGQLQLRIWDNGQGFDPQTATSRMGLMGIRERAAAIGAVFKIVSQLGSGTEVLVTLALPRPDTLSQ